MNASVEPNVLYPVLAVIMARGGSVGLPGKSLRPLLGKPVIQYTFEHAAAAKLVHRTVVSSDDRAILRLARDHGLEVIERPAELATSASATDPVLRHAVRTLQSRDSKFQPAAVVMLYGNVPLRRNEMIDRCVALLARTGCDSVQAVAPVGKMHPYWMFDRDEAGRIRKHVPNDVFRRQDLPPLFSPTGSVYVMRTAVLMGAEKSADPHGFLGTDRRGLVIDPNDTVDIDTARDLFLAEALMREQTV